MALNMLDISGFAGSVWEKDFITSFKTRPNLFSLFRTRAVEPGVKTVKIPVFTSSAASAFTPGAGNTVTLDTGTGSTITLTLDQVYEKSHLIDDFEEMQAAVDVRKPVVELMSNALLQAVDTKVLAICNSYTSLPAAQKYTTSSPVAATAAGVYPEVELAITAGVTKLQSLLGVAGATGKFVILDNVLHNYLLAGSPKQAPERTDYVFGAATGTANPICGAQIINGGETSRVYSAYGDYTTFKCYVACPSAIAVGVQKMPNLEVSRQALYKSWLLSSDIVFGAKEANPNMFYEMNIKVSGDLTAA